MTARRKTDVVIVGGGSFGTALASILAGMGRRVTWWVRNGEQAREIGSRHTNRRYMPGHKLPEKIHVTTDLEAAVRSTQTILMAIPSRSFREVARNLGDHVEGDQIIVHTTKGLEIDTFKPMSTNLR